MFLRAMREPLGIPKFLQASYLCCCFTVLISGALRVVASGAGHRDLGVFALARPRRTATSGLHGPAPRARVPHVAPLPLRRCARSG